MQPLETSTVHLWENESGKGKQQLNKGNKTIWWGKFFFNKWCRDNWIKAKEWSWTPTSHHTQKWTHNESEMGNVINRLNLRDPLKYLRDFHGSLDHTLRITYSPRQSIWGKYGELSSLEPSPPSPFLLLKKALIFRYWPFHADHYEEESWFHTESQGQVLVALS